LIFFLAHAQSIAEVSKSLGSLGSIEKWLLFIDGSKFNQFCIEASRMLCSWSIISSTFYLR